MIILFRFVAITLLIACLAPSALLAGHSLTPIQKNILSQWIGGQTQFRPATDDDCNCSDDIANMKVGYGSPSAAIPDYHPYAVTGDFNGDGYDDFAVGLFDTTRSSKNFAIVIFNGPLKNPVVRTAFFVKGLELENRGLFFLQRQKPYRLILGPFESDNVSIIEPKGKSYTFKYGGPR